VLGKLQILDPALNGFGKIDEGSLMLEPYSMGADSGGGTTNKGGALDERCYALHVGSPDVHTDGHMRGASMKQHFGNITDAKE
jgi:hypothetical protein